jgi:Domain of unknown function (DUF4136)
MLEAHVIRHRANTARHVVTMVITIAALAGIGACTNGNGVTNLISPNNNGIVTTFNDTTFDFTTLRTFAMPDTIVHLFPLAASPQAVSRMLDQTILNQVREDLLNRGYTQVANPVATRPDFIVLVGVTATPNYNAWPGYSWFTFWGFSPGWDFFTPRFTTGWGIVYPWFSLIGATSYDRGTLIIDLIPTSSVDPARQTIRSAWAGVAMGLLNGGVTSARTTTTIDQLFALSPFLTAPSPGASPAVP